MENTNYEPRRLTGGLDGYCPNGMESLRGLGKNRLVDNICLVCYGKALTIEEIARTLSAAAAYIEDHIRELEYMDLLQVVDKNKYTTTFFISTLRHEMIAAKYHYHNIKPYAEKIYAAFDKRYDDIKNIGFLGSDLDKDFVTWAIMPIVLNTLYHKSSSYVLTKQKISIDAPKRKDGSRFWVCSTLGDDHYFSTQTEFTAEEVRFRELSTGNGIKTNADGKRAMLQLDSRATIETGIHWRSCGDSHLMEFHRIAEIIRGGKQITDIDKEIIAKRGIDGYVRVENDTPKMLIPFLFKEEHDVLMKILDDIVAELGENLFADYIDSFAEIFEKELPSFITKEERIYHRDKIYPQYAALYWLATNGYLRYPTDEEAKRLCTIVWET